MDTTVTIKPRSEAYKKQALEKLKSEFARLSIPAIRTTFEESSFIFPSTFHKLRALEDIRQNGGEVPLYLQRFDVIFLKAARRERMHSQLTEPNLLAEMSNMEELQMKRKPTNSNNKENIGVNQDLSLSMEATSATNDDGAFLECECCYDDEVALEDIAQCNNGHLFCIQCITDQVNEQVFGRGCSGVRCLSQDGCKAGFQHSIIKQLPAKTLLAFDELEARESIQAASLSNLEICPKCAYMFECDVEVGDFLTCPIAACKHAYCRLCKEAPHKEQTCQQFKDEQAKTHAYIGAAEAMPSAVVRKCPNPQCGLPFFKEEGCNKMACSKCTTLSCYLCRELIDKANLYSHYCQIPHCQHLSCGKCRLFSNSIEETVSPAMALLE